MGDVARYSLDRVTPEDWEYGDSKSSRQLTSADLDAAKRLAAQELDVGGLHAGQGVQGRRRQLGSLEDADLDVMATEVQDPHATQ
jgi:hypothetical protein